MLLAPFLWIFVNSIKKSLTICLWKNRKIHPDFLRCQIGPIRYSGAAGTDGL